MSTAKQHLYMLNSQVCDCMHKPAHEQGRQNSCMDKRKAHEVPTLSGAILATDGLSEKKYIFPKGCGAREAYHASVLYPGPHR